MAWNLSIRALARALASLGAGMAQLGHVVIVLQVCCFVMAHVPCVILRGAIRFSAAIVTHCLSVQHCDVFLWSDPVPKQ